MLVKNVHIHNREGLWQILIEEGKISRIFPQDEVLNYSDEILDGEEGIVCQFVRPDFCAYSSAKQCAVIYCDSMDRRHFIYAADLLRF